MSLQALNKIPLLLALSICGLSSCGGGSNPRNHEKQRSPADVKINSLNSGTGEFSLRLEYRSHIVNSLKKINCGITFDEKLVISFDQQPEIDLDPFSKEILKFNHSGLLSNSLFTNNNPINYSINCQLKYLKGYESIEGRSVIHQVPGSSTEYR